ncbi:MAG: hypothetical protein V3T86_15750 [Planctomycetota bacterium]
MLNPRRIAPLLVALLLAPVLADEKPKKAKPFPYSDKSGKYTITVPGGWTTEDPRLTYNDTVLKVRLNGTLQRQSADVNIISGRMGPPTAQPKAAAEGERNNVPNPSHHETGMSPLPHLAWHYTKDEDEHVRLFVYRKIRGLGFRIILDLPKGFLEKERANLFSVCASLKADIPPHPPYPKEYKVEKKGFFVFLTHPRVKQKTNDLKKLVGKQAKAFGKFHQLPKETDAPAQILIHPDREDARSIKKEVADANEAVYLDLNDARMFAVPFITDPTKVPSSVAQFTQYLLLMQAYGSIGPQWVGRGESIVARIEFETGKKLPNILEGWERGFLANPIKPLPDVRKMSDQNTMVKHAGVYIGFFKRGDKKYRKIYRAFLDEWRTTGDFAAAEEKHILSLDQAKLHKAATNWRRRKLKHVKVKK